MLTKVSIIEKRWFWGLSLGSVIATTVIWMIVGVIHMTRTIPGWIIIRNPEDNHTLFLAEAWTLGILTLVTMIADSIHLFYYVQDYYHEFFFEKVEVAAHLLTIIFAFLVALAFSWGYDTRFEGSAPYRTDILTTIEWKVYNQAVTICAATVLIASFYVFAAFARLWPSKTTK
jgi:hypothetical protein